MDRVRNSVDEAALLVDAQVLEPLDKNSNKLRTAPDHHAMHRSED